MSGGQAEGNRQGCNVMELWAGHCLASYRCADSQVFTIGLQ